MVERCQTPPPPYGSAAWLALPDSSIKKVAAVVVAAEAWARSGDTLEEDLRIEMERLAYAYKRDEDADYAARAKAHREHWQGFLSGPIPLRPNRSDGGAE
jgi:hypothetical protein